MLFIRHRTQLLIVLAITLVTAGLLSMRDYYLDYEIGFSSESGFYDEPFSLKIEGGGSYDIFYTLDGSEPTRDSIAYRPGDMIAIADASENENILSNRTDISAGYSEYASNPHGFAVPDQKVDKCTIVRASVISKNGDIEKE